MEAALGLVAGFSTGVFITLIPGMLNMQVVATSLRLGRRGGYLFAAGLVVVIAVQAVLAVLFADYLTDFHVIPLIKKWAIPLLAGLAIAFTAKGYLAMRARHRHEDDKPYKGDPFWRGFMMSAMNILNIPFIFAVATFHVAHGYLPDAPLPRIMFVPGVVLGASTTFFFYARTAGWISRHASYFTRNIYFFLGALLAAGTVVQIFRVS